MNRRYLISVQPKVVTELELKNESNEANCGNQGLPAIRS